MTDTLLPLYINGQKIHSNSGETFTNFRPLDGGVECEVSLASKEDVDQAVRAAQSAFETWAGTPGMERGRILLRAAEIMRRRRQELAMIEVIDTGKPISETPYADVDSAIDALEFFGGLAMDIRGDYHDLGSSAWHIQSANRSVCALVSGRGTIHFRSRRGNLPLPWPLVMPWCSSPLN